jgi:hypothetical protein
MKTTDSNGIRRLGPAAQEVKTATHDQDLPEVAKRAKLDRTADHRAAQKLQDAPPAPGKG